MTDPQKFINQPLSAHITNVGTHEQLVELQDKVLPEIDAFLRGLLPEFGFIVITVTPRRDGHHPRINMLKSYTVEGAIQVLAHQIMVHAAGTYGNVEIKK